MPQRGSSATEGSMTTSHRSSAMSSTVCQSHSASSLFNSVYSSFYHFTELLQSTCTIIAALGLIPPRLGYVYDHWRRPISGCGGRTLAIVLSLPPVLDAGTAVSLLLFVLLTQWTHLKCSLKLTC